MTGRKYFSVETLGGAFLLGWGFFVGNPYVDTFQKNPFLYQPMTAIASEFYWGAIVFLLGCVSIYFCARNELHSAALILTIVNSLFAFLFFIGDFQSFAWYFYMTLAVWNAVHYKSYKRE